MELGDLSALKGVAITAGSVFLIEAFSSDGITPKNGDSSRHKFFVILGVSSDHVCAGTVVINSEINLKLIDKIGKYQHHILKTNNGFLSKDTSYIDCYKIFEFTFERISECGKYLGVLSADDLEAAVRLVKTSPVVSLATLKKFGLV